MKFYDFFDKQPAIGRLVVIEGTQRALAEQALETLLDRLLPPETRDLNLSRFTPEDLSDLARPREAVQAMPFLAERRVVVLTETQTLRAAQREAALSVAAQVPEGNVMILMDLLAPRSKRPQPFGVALGRAALRIDTTADDETRARFVAETLERLGAKAQPRAVDALVRSESDLVSIRNDIEKLALTGKTITLAALQTDSLSLPDPVAYKYASALAQGKVSAALGIAHELFSTDRGAGVKLLSALAAECSFLWELSRPNGRLPDRFRWREPQLRSLAHGIGTRRTRLAYERAVAGIAAIVTGRAGNYPEDRTLVDRISIELSALLRR